MDSLDETLRQIIAFRDERDWAQFHAPRNLAAALAIEAGEIQEAMLWKADEEVERLLASRRGRSKLTQEMADVLIYALLLCNAAQIDPIEAINKKLRMNKKKYPVNLSKGKATKYTRLRREEKQL